VISAWGGGGGGGPPFALLWLAAGIAVLVEWTEISRVAPRRALQALMGAALAALLAAWLLRLPGWAGPAVAAAAALSAWLAAASARDRLWTIGGFAYAAVIVIAPVVIRDHPQAGALGVLWIFAVVWTTDVAAYFTGRRLGGPKLWPRFSPKKTWSGFAGGLLAGALAGTLVVALGRRWGVPTPPLWLVCLVSAAASVVGQLGDLAESALKRYLNVKDSGRLIPGHGGVMDRLDAFWPVALLTALAFAALARPDGAG
jgi:phosphatidate cytidylyltransferase